MTSRQLLPDGLATAAPGPELACALDGVDPGRLSGADTVAAMTAAFRQRNHTDAVLLACELEAGLAEDPDTLARAELVGEFTGDEARAALGYSRTTANLRVLLAADLTRRLPRVYAAQYDGALELAKARVFSEWTADTDRPVSDEVCRRVLADAPRLTVATLQKRIVAVVLALDPEWADRRRAASEAEARVIARRTESGTANLGGYDLPLARVVPVMSRVEALAARAKRGGAVGRIAWLRAEVFLCLLDRRWHDLDDDQIVADLIAQHGPDHPDDGGPDSGGPEDGGPDDGGPCSDQPDDDGPDSGGPEDGGPDDGGPWSDHPDDDGPDSGGPDDGGPDDGGPDDGGPDDGGPDDGGPDDSLSATGSTNGGPDAEADGAGGGAAPGEPHGDPGARRAGTEGGAGGAWKGRCRDGTVEVRAQLSTLLGLDDHPGEIAGWGPALPHQLRAMVADAAQAQWRLVYTDPDGRLLHVDLTRRRPTGCRDTRTGTRGPEIVELQIPLGLLEPCPRGSRPGSAVLDPAAFPAWAAVIIDARRRLASFRARRPPPPPAPHMGTAPGMAPTGASAPPHAPTREGPDAERLPGVRPPGERPPGERPPGERSAGEDLAGEGPAGRGPDGDGRRRRLARAELDRWVRVRDRSCIGVACPAPAHRSDIDHTIDWHRDGPTDPANLGAPCTHDHRLKHLGGWRLTQPAQGCFRWRTRTGTTYDVTVPRVVPDLPDPLPGRRLGPVPAGRPDTVDDGPDDPDGTGDPVGTTSTAWSNHPEPPRTVPQPPRNTAAYAADPPF